MADNNNNTSEVQAPATTSEGAASTRQAPIFRAKRPMMAGRKFQDDVTIGSGTVGGERFILSLARSEYGYGAIVAWANENCFVDGTAHAIEASNPEDATRKALDWIRHAFTNPTKLDDADPSSLHITDLVPLNEEEDEAYEAEGKFEGEEDGDDVENDEDDDAEADEDLEQCPFCGRKVGARGYIECDKCSQHFCDRCDENGTSDTKLCRDCRSVEQAVWTIDQNTIHDDIISIYGDEPGKAILAKLDMRSFAIEYASQLNDAMSWDEFFTETVVAPALKRALEALKIELPKD
ncbi:MAG: hypothetical protein GYA24_05215 [Candidatus Lokiarchaeota archaeon]|nr:hypothetical protein [Candidatus Lokiarchaeota archaeon]